MSAPTLPSPGVPGQGKKRNAPGLSHARLVVACLMLCAGCVPARRYEGRATAGGAVHTILIVVAPQAREAGADRIIQVLRRQLAERCGVEARVAGPGAALASDELRLVLDLDRHLGPETFRIESGRNSLHITGGDRRGLLYGVGKFLHNGRLHEGSFEPGPWRGISAPHCRLRGIYFATHFHNFYHEAPIEQVQSYLEDLSLWGFNTVMVWFDMHAYRGIKDPEARAMLRRLGALLGAAKSIGLDTGLVAIANEAYADSPPSMRADWTAGHNGYTSEPQGHYHVELCPHKPGACELLLRWRKEVLEAFKPVGIDYLCLWPYDQGGCTGPECAPWGCNGFLYIAGPVARLFRQEFPRGKVVLSTWYFDRFTNGEWKGLEKAFGPKPHWVDYLLADDAGSSPYPPYPLEHGVPGGLPLLNFPEISMWGAEPWGGFGANPCPIRLEARWRQTDDKLDGGFPYSEGIYEDLNKVICSRLYWEGDAAAADSALRDYAAYEYSPDVADDVCQAVKLLEQTLPRIRHDDGGVTRFVLSNPKEVLHARELLDEADRKLPAPIRGAWRWRILYLRGMIDCELVTHDGRISNACETALEELSRLYHADQAASYVAPPTTQALRDRRGP